MPNIKITLNDGTTKTVRFDDGFTEADIEEVASQLNANIKSEKKGIDLTPSGAYKKVVAGAVAPIRALTHKQSVPEAYQTGLEKLEEFKPAGGAGDFIFDTAVYSRLPMLKGASAAGKVGAFAGNAAIQGGLPGLLEGAKEGKALEGAGAGTGIAVGVQGALSGLPVVGRGITKVINAPKFQQGVANTLEALTSVPSDYSKTALQNELAGNSIFKGGFDADTAYIPIERKLRQAKEMLPTKEYYQELYKKLGDEVRTKLNNEIMPESWYDEQYKNLGLSLNQKMQDAIKPDVYFDTAYNQIGEKLLNSINNLKGVAGNELDNVLNGMAGTTSNIGGLRQSINNIIKNAARGGEFNPAELKAGKDLAPVLELLQNAKTKPINLHNAKEFLYDTANYETSGGIKNNTLKNVANQINNFLRQNPAYAAANDKYSNIMNIIKGIGGDDARTIATKLKDYGSGTSIRSGADSYFRELDSIMPSNDKFLKDLGKIQDELAVQNFLKDNIKQGVLNNINKYDSLLPNQQELLKYLAPDEIARYKDLSLQQGIESNLNSQLGESLLNDISKYNKAPYEVQNTLEVFAPNQLKKFQKLNNEEKNVNDLKNAIGQQYERNPRLLANRTDEAFENAINDLQKKTGVNFMDELQKIRAREAFEKWFPGQGGGSGSSQGFGNLLRTALIGGAPTAAAITHNPAALLGLGAVSPKFTGKGAIQNLGRLNQMAQGWQNLVPENIQRLLTSALVQLGVGE